MTEIERLLEHDAAGDPITGLRWMRKTTAKVAAQLMPARHSGKRTHGRPIAPQAESFAAREPGRSWARATRIETGSSATSLNCASASVGRAIRLLVWMPRNGKW